MSITTKRGDDGHTDLMFAQRVPKNHPRVEAYGSVDELNSVIGIIHHLNPPAETQELIDTVQDKLIPMMGELATLEEDLPRYIEKGYGRLTDEDVQWIENTTKSLEKEHEVKFKGWAKPGKEGTLLAAQCDVSRAVCRRAERRVADLKIAQALSNDNIALFLNRLSDLLWVLARIHSA